MSSTVERKAIVIGKKGDHGQNSCFSDPNLCYELF